MSCFEEEVVIVMLIFVRHGKDDDRFRGGWSDLDLTLEGMEQAKQLARHLKENKQKYGISRIVSSDLPRAMTTASFISFELGIPIQKELRLRETNNGDLAGMPNDAALEKYPGLFFSSLEMDEAYPNGESPNAFYARIKAWFSEFSSDCRNTKGNILVVTHGGVINIIYHLVKGIAWTNKSRPFKADNCGIHILNLDTMEFESENETGFLRT